MPGTDPLHRRLLGLRQRHFDTAMTQPVLGRLLGVEAPTISSWEHGKAIPPIERITAYATLFASRRSVEAGRLLHEDELSEAERADQALLNAELLELRRRALDSPASEDEADDPLTFRDGEPVRIICGKLDTPHKSAAGHRWNYMALSAYADLDALIQLYGHLRARNPHADVRHKLAGRIEGRDLRAHLVLLGNLAVKQTDLRYLMPDLPVHQVPDEELDEAGEVFEVRDTGQRLGPSFAGPEDDLRVVGDLGLMARMPSPVDPARTLTVFGGIFTRGVYGAVRCLTDSQIGPGNVRWLGDRFADATVWGVLMHVRGADHAIGTPRLSESDVVEYSFPDP